MTSCDPCQYAEQPSVIVHVVDQDMDHGNRFVDAESIRYEWIDDYGEVQSKPGECIGNDCSKFKVGVGAPGDYKIYATVCGREFGTEVRVDAEEGTCEVETVVTELPVDTSQCEPTIVEELPLNSKKIECTKWAQPSIIVRVMAEINGELMPVRAEEVTYTWSGDPDSRAIPAKCLTPSCSVAAAGFEQTGHFEVTAKACGKEASVEAAIQKTADSCHVATEEFELVLDGSECYEVQEIDPEDLPSTCQASIVPSAYIFPMNQVDGVWAPRGTESLVYEYDGERHEGYCARREEASDRCTMWVVGWNKSGRFKAYTDTCGVDTAVEFSVGLTEDECYPATKYIHVDVDTRGCIRAPDLGSDDAR